MGKNQHLDTYSLFELFNLLTTVVPNACRDQCCKYGVHL